MKLTTEAMSKLTCPEGAKDLLVFDTALPGFGCRVTPRSRTFLVQYRANGIRRRIALGRFGVLTPDQARARAKEVLGKVAGGADPYAERAARAAAEQTRRVEAAAKAAADLFTVRALADAWLAARADDRRPSYLGEAGRSIRRNFVSLLDRPAASVTITEAVQALDAVKRTSGPVAANRALAYARAAYGWAVRRQMVGSNPFKNLERPSSERTRDRVLLLPELGAIWRAALVLGEPYGPALRLLMLTAARRDEIAAMRWNEIDNADAPKTWTLPSNRSKNHRAHVVHLSAPARDILTALPRRMDSPFVFPGRSGRPLTGWSNPVTRLRAALTDAGDDLGDWRLHDFRRSAVTFLASNGVAPHVADRLLNHVTGAIQGVAAVYQRHSFETERRAALDGWAAAIVAAAERRAPATNVVPLRA